MNRHGIACPVHFHDFTGFPLDPERCLRGTGIGTVLVTELCVLVGKQSLRLTLGAILGPQQGHSYPRLCELIGNVLVIRDLSSLMDTLARIEDLLKLLISQGVR